MKFYGNKIKEIREFKGITQLKLADITGISNVYISKLELGKKENPSAQILNKIANALDVSVNEFYKDEKLDSALKQLNEINETITQYYESKNDKKTIKELQFDAEINLLMNEIKKLSEKDRKVVEVLVSQLLKEE